MKVRHELQYRGNELRGAKWNVLRGTINNEKFTLEHLKGSS